jgi:hypothetical protein
MLYEKGNYPMGRRFHIVYLCIFLLAGALSSEASDRIPVERAVDRLFEFLVADGEKVSFEKEKFVKGLPKPGVREDRILGEYYVFRDPKGFGTFMISTEDGTVFEATPNEPNLRIRIHDKANKRLSREDLVKQVQEKAVLSLEEALAKAAGYVKARYRDFGKRNFHLAKKEIRITGRLASYEIVWREKPGKGEVAIFENKISLCMNPKTGRITSYMATDLRLRTTEPPKVDQSQAIETARKSVGSFRKKDSGVSLSGKPKISLVLIPNSDRKSGRLVWTAVFRFSGRATVIRGVQIDAATGEVIRRFR